MSMSIEERAVQDLERLGRALADKRGGGTPRRQRQVKVAMAPRFVDESDIHRPEPTETGPVASRITPDVLCDDLPIPMAARGPRANTGLAIVVDTREQAPFSFDRFQDVVEVRRGMLKTGDYSLAGHEDIIAIERKELGDLINCLSHDRPRFERELARAAKGLRFFAVVCEGAWEDIARGRYRSQMRPESALQSIFAFSVRYKVPFILAGSRRAAEYVTHGLLRQYARDDTTLCQGDRVASKPVQPERVEV